MLKHFASLIVVSGLLLPQTAAPERKVESNSINSERDPKIRIVLPTSAQYVGADRWNLYDIADCELHAFVEPDAEKNIERLYWVQFEGYLASKPELKHTYDSPRHAEIAGWDFFVDTWVREAHAETQKGSDREHLEALLRTRGYKMPAGMMYVRLVHLLDERKRKELMIIYGEDLAPTGLSAAELGEHGKAFNRWPAIEKELITRAEKAIALQAAGPRGRSQTSLGNE